MNKIIKNKFLVLVVALIFTSLFISCSDFLNDPEIEKDPNRATTVSADLLFNSIQVRQFFRYEGHLSRTTSIWMQQLGGVDRQSLGLGQYIFTENEWNGEMGGIYTGGALIDIRNIRAEAKSKGWRTYEGIAKFYEAFVVGMSASLWGDLPYSEAVSTVATPKLDGQISIYNACITLLIEAIADLTAGGGYKPPNDHVYAGDNAKWIQAANTLLARYYLHLAEVDPSNYAKALAAIQKGISTNANNFKTKHTTVESESNAIYQFWRQRDSYIRAGKYMVDLLKGKSDPRLDKYFQTGRGTLAGKFEGAAPGQALTDASNLSAAILANSFSFDIMSFSEANLIWAECAFKAGDAATALAKLNAARRAEEGRWALTANSLGVASGLTGTALIDAIMQEKYIALFLNIEAYNDWKRTNRPAITPYAGAQIPRRLLYGDGERITNPNIPTPSQQPARNANDPGDSY
jgi:hypothetical protein